VCPNPADTSLSANPRYNALGSVSKVEMMTPTALIYKVLFPSISTFETPPGKGRMEEAKAIL
jgi:hypothetical protein